MIILRPFGRDRHSDQLHRPPKREIILARSRFDKESREAPAYRGRSIRVISILDEVIALIVHRKIKLTLRGKPQSQL